MHDIGRHSLSKPTAPDRCPTGVSGQAGTPVRGTDRRAGAAQVGAQVVLRGGRSTVMPRRHQRVVQFALGLLSALVIVAVAFLPWREVGPRILSSPAATFLRWVSPGRRQVWWSWPFWHSLWACSSIAATGRRASSSHRVWGSSCWCWPFRSIRRHRCSSPVRAAHPPRDAVAILAGVLIAFVGAPGHLAADQEFSSRSVRTELTDTDHPARTTVEIPAHRGSRIRAPIRREMPYFRVVSHDTLAWHDFFLGTIGAAAALTGLLFVAISINLEEILKSRGYRVERRGPWGSW